MGLDMQANTSQLAVALENDPGVSRTSLGIKLSELAMSAVYKGGGASAGMIFPKRSSPENWRREPSFTPLSLKTRNHKGDGFNISHHPISLILKKAPNMCQAWVLALGLTSLQPQNNPTRVLLLPLFYR